MASGINGSSLIRNINDARKGIEDIFAKLSSGLRANKASDDAAGLAIVASLDADISISSQASRNIDYGESLATIRDTALGEIGKIQERQAELAQSAANGTLTDSQRTTLNQEFQQLEEEKVRILESTNFNGVNVFEKTDIQIDGSQLTLSKVDVSTIKASSGDISTQAGAQSAIDTVKQRVELVASSRGEVGSVVSRFSVAKSNLGTKVIQNQAAAGRIRDADYAELTANLAGKKIREQGGASLLAQAGKLEAKRVLSFLS